jgi:hypothetical protein
VLAIEDARFYAHNGVDVKGTIRAAVENAQANGVTQGGSTLTQQYVKNALLQAATTKEEQAAPARCRSTASCARPATRWPWSGSSPRTRSSSGT